MYDEILPNGSPRSNVYPRVWKIEICNTHWRKGVFLHFLSFRSKIIIHWKTISKRKKHSKEQQFSSVHSICNSYRSKVSPPCRTIIFLFCSEMVKNHIRNAITFILYPIAKKKQMNVWMTKTTPWNLTNVMTLPQKKPCPPSYARSSIVRWKNHSKQLIEVTHRSRYNALLNRSTDL